MFSLDLKGIKKYKSLVIGEEVTEGTFKKSRIIIVIK